MAERKDDAGTAGVPWRLERAPLTAPAVRALLADRFHGLALDAVVPLGEGWDCETWLVDDTWVFRFPKRAEVQPSLQRECAMLPLLGERLPVRVPVPEWQGEPAADFPFAFFGYRLIPGRALDWAERPSQPLETFEADFAALLNALHGSTAAARVAVAGVEQNYPESYAPLDWHAELLRVRPTLEAHLSDRALAATAALVNGRIEPPPAYPGDAVLLHYDLCGDHVLMAADSGRILGVIDWADAGFGDPAIDLIEATLWLGPAFLERFLARYDHPVDPGLRTRVRYGASVIALLNVAYAIERGQEQLAQRRRRHLEETMLPRGELYSGDR